jgi:hypothetical protein
MFRPGILLTLGFVGAVSTLACMSTSAPTTTSAKGSPPAPPTPLAPALAQPSASASVTNPTPAPEAEAKPGGIARRAFYAAFLGAADVGDRFQSLAEPDVARGLARHYRAGQKPPGLWWVADASWSDPHSNESLRRIEETRWYFADEATASRLVASIIATLHQDTRTEDVEGPSFGSDCHVLKSTIEGTIGTMTYYFYVFRVGRLVAQVRFDQGPRSRAVLTEDLVIPFARQASERVAAAEATEVAAAR